MNNLDKPEDDSTVCEMCGSETDEVICPFCKWDHNNERYVDDDEEDSSDH